MVALVFRDLILFSIRHPTMTIFVGPCAKVLLQIVHFYQGPMEQCHQQTGVSGFVYGGVLVCHSRISRGVIDSGQGPVVCLQWG